MMQSRAFVPSIPLQTSSTSPAAASSSSSGFYPSPPFTSSRRQRSSQSRATPQRRPTTVAALPASVCSDESTSLPSPADWLRANEAALRRPDTNALRVGVAPVSSTETPPIPIPTPGRRARAVVSSASASSPPRAARVAVPSAAPRVAGAGLVLEGSPPSYCTVGSDLDHVVAELDARVLYLGPVARNKVVCAIELARAGAASPARLAENVTVALIVADLQMDCDTVCAAVLRNVVGAPGCPAAAVEHQVGADVLTILRFHAQLEESVRLCVDASFTELSFSNLRELILVRAVEEHRAISLELARAVRAIRTIDALEDEQSRLAVARRTMYLYAPLANQLGIWFVQSELEELAFMYLDPHSFEMIRHLVGERRRECEDMLSESKHFLERILSRTPEVRNLIRTVRIKGRVKGLYSVYRKMRRSGKKVYEIYDLLALRVVVQPKRADDEAEIAACYAVANVIKQFYETFESRAKDYIAMPKRNGYRSVHMTVLPQGGSTPLEIQIRSEKMHHVAEFGAAAHWIYKEASVEQVDDLSSDCLVENDMASDLETDTDGEVNDVEDDDDDDDDDDNNDDDDVVFSDDDNDDEGINKGGSRREARHSVQQMSSPRSKAEWSVPRLARHAVVNVNTAPRERVSSRSTRSSYPRPRVAIPPTAATATTTSTTTSTAAAAAAALVMDRDAQCAEERMRALARERESMQRRVGSEELQHELRGGYVTCLASAIRASRVIVATAGQLYGLAVGSTLFDLASGLGVATLGAIAVVNDKVVPLTQRLEMNDIVRFINV